MGRPKRQAYTALDGRYIDQEKNISIEDGSDSASDASYSSRDVSGSHEPMLRNGRSTRPKALSFSYAMPRRRFTRYFTCIIATGLVLLVLSLTRLKVVSEAEIRLGLQKPPAPPAPWEDFPFLKRYHGGIRTLVKRSSNKAEYPDPDNNGVELEGQAEGTKEERSETAVPVAYDPFLKGANQQSDPPTPCFLDKSEKTRVPALRGYDGVPSGFPDPVMGSYELMNLDKDTCFDRYGRLGPYGYGYSMKYGGIGSGIEGEGRDEAMQAIWGDSLEVDYSTVNWGEAQARCVAKNSFRLGGNITTRNHFYQLMSSGGPEDDMGSMKAPDARISTRDAPVTKLVPRHAVVIRTWVGFEYDHEDILYLRALTNELALTSGGEYTIHFLIQVKDDKLPIWSDDATYQRVLNDALPAEFRGMGTLWSERQMSLVYGGVSETVFRDLPVFGVYRSTYMPMQYFAHMHPEYDFFWHWEMDVRYTGHYYSLFDRVGKWAAQQPRKGLWERNGRFYIPSEHGSWQDFTQMVRVQSEHGTGHRSNMYSKMGSDPKTPDQANDKPDPPIWGPMPPTGEGNVIDTTNDPVPPTTYSKDEHIWGVGEDADFITFNPLFDPDKTNWILANDVTGYNTSEGYPARRTAIITASRLSRKLLETMHKETALQKHTMFSEMWPGSVSLHHGLKAVYAPHPVYIDRKWPTSYLAAIFNNGRNGASGGARTSVFSDERQHNFLGTTWYYHAGFPANLWKRWFGYKVDNDGGEEDEKVGEGRMCLPGMLLHPVKQVDLIYEHQVGQ